MRRTVYKVLYVIDTLEVGGAERSLLHMARRLDASRFELVVCHPYAGSALRAEFERAGARVVGFDLKGKYQFPTALRRLARLTKLEQPDLIHTTLFRSDQVGRAVGRWRKIPVVSSFVNLSYDHSRVVGNEHVNARKLGALRMLDSLTARWVTRFHAVSTTVKRSNCKHLKVSPQRVSVVPRGREVNGPRTLTDRPTSPTILNVGRLVDQKAQNYLIEAMQTVIARHSDARLLIAGEGPLRGELESLVARLKLARHVEFLGQRDDIDQLLHSSDVFAFPSIYEGMPGSVIEAMLAGLPIVASNIAPNRELIEHGKSGLLVAVKDSAALAEGLLELLADRQRASRLGANARAAAVKQFDVDEIAKSMQELYDEVIQMSRRRQPPSCGHAEPPASHSQTRPAVATEDTVTT